jgi:hypothetical protein
MEREVFGGKRRPQNFVFVSAKRRVFVLRKRSFV